MIRSCRNAKMESITTMMATWTSQTIRIVALSSTQRAGEDDVVLPQCANGLDDDEDGLVDLADPGCSSVADPELDGDGERLAAC